VLEHVARAPSLEAAAAGLWSLLTTETGGGLIDVAAE